MYLSFVLAFGGLVAGIDVFSSSVRTASVCVCTYSCQPEVLTDALPLLALPRLHRTQKNGVHIACHFLGGLMLARAMLRSLASSYLWHVVLVAHIPTACCTLDAAVRLLRTASSSSHARY